ncbi:hypothetical protein CsSME_00027135 [Camellia sinensis var. sinensis]
MVWYVVLNIIMIIMSSFLLPVGASEDSIRAGKSININEALTSAGGNFALGFFIIWVANRENLLAKNSHGVFGLGDDGNIVLLHGGKKVIWSSNATIAKLAMNSTVTVLLDTGNLVLRHGETGTVLGQSFDYPADTLIPGMKLSLNRKTGQQSLLYSWANNANPRPGMFSRETTLHCVNWFGALVDLNHNAFIGKDLYVCLHSSDQVSNAKTGNLTPKRRIPIAIAAATISTGLLFISIIGYVLRRGRLRNPGTISPNRFQIIEGIGQGLICCHKYSRLKVIHRNLKASNILLDEALNPKILDFRTARSFRINQTDANTSTCLFYLHEFQHANYSSQTSSSYFNNEVTITMPELVHKKHTYDDIVTCLLDKAEMLEREIYDLSWAELVWASIKSSVESMLR